MQDSVFLKIVATRFCNFSHRALPTEYWLLQLCHPQTMTLFLLLKATKAHCGQNTERQKRFVGFHSNFSIFNSNLFIFERKIA